MIFFKKKKENKKIIPGISRKGRGMDVSILSVGLFKVNFHFVSSCASSVVKAIFSFLFFFVKKT